MDSSNNETAATARPATIVGGPPRTRTVSLTWPVEFGGRVYSEVTIRRLTAAEVDAFVQAAMAGDKNASLPLYDAPSEVLAAMDADDAAALNEAATPFLPRSLRMGGGSESQTSAGSVGSSPAA